MNAEIKGKLERRGFEQVLEYRDDRTEIDIFVCSNAILKIQSWAKC